MEPVRKGGCIVDLEHRDLLSPWRLIIHFRLLDADTTHDDPRKSRLLAANIGFAALDRESLDDDVVARARDDRGRLHNCSCGLRLERSHHHRLLCSKALSHPVRRAGTGSLLAPPGSSNHTQAGNRRSPRAGQDIGMRTRHMSRARQESEPPVRAIIEHSCRFRQSDEPRSRADCCQERRVRLLPSRSYGRPLPQQCRARRGPLSH